MAASSSSSQGPSVVLASADAALRLRLRSSLSAMRWQVREAAGGAEALAQLEEQRTDALLLDQWLPDLEVAELAASLPAMYPGLDILRIGAGPVEGCTPSARRHELLHALREAQTEMPPDAPAFVEPSAAVIQRQPDYQAHDYKAMVAPTSVARPPPPPVPIDGMIGQSAAMRDLAHLIRLVAPRRATVLIEGETGTGKELVAQSLHRLSPRAAKPLVALNCAAIPESLLEAELFGHTRGAFTGAVQARAGRIEAAHGGTLFLDEIGEMPLALQSKMLRFLECGELQRVGDNEVLRVDVRVIAATHQQLEERAAAGLFRLDLYHRLAVFPIDVPPLRDRAEDIPALAEFFLAEQAKHSPAKRLHPDALAVLLAHNWPGNVRELAHVLERASILAADLPVLEPAHVRIRRELRS